MRTMGIDLSVKGEHKVVIADEQGRAVSPVLKISTTPVSLARLLELAQEGNCDGQLQAVMESTGMAWLPVAVFLNRHGVQVYLVNSQQVADLRRYYKKHAKSDRIDCRVLSKLPLVNPDNLHPWHLQPAAGLACQRGCKQLGRLQKQITAVKNRLIALDRFAWPGLEKSVFKKTFSPAAQWFREHWYNPQRVCQAGVEHIRQQWLASELASKDPGDWVEYLVELAQQVMGLYGSDGQFLDYRLLQMEAGREQALLRFLEAQHHQLQIKVVRPLYRKLHPSRNLETIPGVGQDGACVYASYIGPAERFASLREHRSWSGMVPYSKQSADSQSSGLRITKAGPRLIKKFSYLDAESARQNDPQIAALYYDQMMNKGKHHQQAICACATHLLDRVLVVWREDRPYQLQDVDGTPLTKKQARGIVQARYKVPDEVRRRNNKNARRERRERLAEKREEGRLRR
jgi:transposase